MKSDFLRKTISILLVLTMVFALAACSSSSADSDETEAAENETSAETEAETETAGSSETVTIRLDVVTSGTQAIAAYVMQAENLAEKYNINLEIHENSGAWGAEWTSLKSDEVDCVITAWTYVSMNYADIETVCVAPFFGWGNSVVTASDSGITGLEDMSGINLGVYQTTALDWVLMCAAAEQEYGIDLSEENEINEAASSLLGGMLEQGNIDAALSYCDTNVILAASGDYDVILDASDCLDILGLDQDAPFLFYTFSREFYEEYPDTVAAFVEMYEDVYEILMTDDDIWYDIAAECFDVTDEEAVPQLMETVREAILYENTEDTQQQCQDILDWCLENGYEDLIGITSIPDDFIIVQ